MKRSTYSDCIRSGWVSYQGGNYVGPFEQALTRLTRRKHALATVNGTVGLHAALTAIDVKRDDEVILPSVTFVASANSIAQAGATPHLVDIEPRTLGP